MEVNGIAHIQLTVTNVKESMKFYAPFLHFLEMMTLIQTDEDFYCIGSRTGIALSQLDPALEGDRFAQRKYRPKL